MNWHRLHYLWEPVIIPTIEPKEGERVVLPPRWSIHRLNPPKHKVVHIITYYVTRYLVRRKLKWARN